MPKNKNFSSVIQVVGSRWGWSRLMMRSPGSAWNPCSSTWKSPRSTWTSLISAIIAILVGATPIFSYRWAQWTKDGRKWKGNSKKKNERNLIHLPLRGPLNKGERPRLPLNLFSKKTGVFGPRPAKLGELPQSEFDLELFSHREGLKKNFFLGIFPK